MPLMLHGLDVLRVNAFIVASKLGWKPVGHNPAHKEFIAGFVKSLLARATTYETRITRRAFATALTPSPQIPWKRQRVSTKNPSLPDHRLIGDLVDHLKVNAPKQGICRMCTYLFHKAKVRHQLPLPKVRRPKKWCSLCKDHVRYVNTTFVTNILTTTIVLDNYFSGLILYCIHVL